MVRGLQSLRTQQCPIYLLPNRCNKIPSSSTGKTALRSCTWTSIDSKLVSSTTMRKRPPSSLRLSRRNLDLFLQDAPVAYGFESGFWVSDLTFMSRQSVLGRTTVPCASFLVVQLSFLVLQRHRTGGGQLVLTVGSLQNILVLGLASTRPGSPNPPFDSIEQVSCGLWFGELLTTVSLSCPNWGRDKNRLSAAV